MGVRIASLIAYLRTCLRLPVRLIQEYLRTRHDLVISTEEIPVGTSVAPVGTSVAVDLLHRVAQADKVQQAAQVINERVRKSPVVHDPWQGSTLHPCHVGTTPNILAREHSRTPFEKGEVWGHPQTLAASSSRTPLCLLFAQYL